MNNDDNKTPDAEQPSVPDTATPAADSSAASSEASPVADAETQRLPEQPPAAVSSTPGEADAAPASSGRRRRNILWGVAAGVLLLGVAGGAYAIGANVGDNDDDDRTTSQQGPGQGGPGQGDGGQHGPGGHGDRDGDDRGDRDDASTDATSSVPADAASLKEAAEAAVAAADAEGVVSIEVENGGYEIEVRLADDTEPDVFVTTDGAATVRNDDDADTSPEPLLDLDKLSDLIAAALEAASAEAGTDGTIHSVSTSDDSTHLYEVDVRMPDGSDVDVDLDADLAVVSSGVDS